MSEPKFTKGEWIIVYGQDFGKNRMPESIRVKEWGNNDLMGDYQGCIICDLKESHGNRSHSYSEAEANAKLICAAPDLLKGCRAAIAIFQSEGINESHPIVGEVFSQITSAVSKAVS